MKKRVFILSTMIASIVLVNCEKKQNQGTMVAQNQKKTSVNSREVQSSYEFVSSCGMDSKSFYKMRVEMIDNTAYVKSEKRLGTDFNYSTYNFIGQKKVDASVENNTLVTLKENVTYFFVPFNPNVEPVAFVSGGLGVRFWCSCHNEAGSAGFCTTDITVTSNTGTVKCTTYGCIWCELKHGGIADPLYITVQNKMSENFGTFIECKSLNLNGKNYTTK